MALARLYTYNVSDRPVDVAISAKDEALITQLSALPYNFWDFKNTSTREFTHGLHNYPAVMVSPISRNILKIIQSISSVETLLDPFVGSGTTLVEGVVSGVAKIYGNDLNPLARLMSKVKSTPISRERLQTTYDQLMMNVEFEMAMNEELRLSVDSYITDKLGLDITAKDGWGSNAIYYLTQYLVSMNKTMSLPDFKNIGYWHKPRILLELQIIKNCIKELPNGDERDFVWVAFSEIIRLVSNRRNGEFKMHRMQAEKIRKFEPNVKSKFSDVLKRNIDKMDTFYNACNGLKATTSISILAENSMVISGVPNDSIDLMITSPPYGDSRTTVAYGEFSKLSLLWLDLEDVSESVVGAMDRTLMGGKKYRNGFEYTLDSETLKLSLEKIKDVDIERAGDVFSFYHELDSAISAIASKMKRGGYQFWVVGNRTVKLENLQTDKILIELSKKYGLVHVYSIDRNIPNKVMPSLNSPTNVTGEKVKTMTNEHIVVFRKAFQAQAPPTAHAMGNFYKLKDGCMQTKRSKLNTIQKREKLNSVYRVGDVGPGGAYHEYLITPNDVSSKEPFSTILFQKGPRKDLNSIHGILDTDLLEIVRDRLKHFQQGEYSTRENASALTHIEEALMWMNKRVEDRIERDVLGTYEK